MPRQVSSHRQIPLELHGQNVTVQLIKRRGARHLTIRLAPERAIVKLTLPPYVSYRAAEDFLTEKHDWLLHHWPREASPQKMLNPGDTITLLGTHYQLFVENAPRPSVVLENGIVRVRAADNWQTHLLRFLKQYARDELGRMARFHAEKLGVRIAKVGVRDMHSRWGSCSRSRTLSFNWRLIFAPYAVADYVCAHEAAHLIEHNHSDRFWAVVATLDPAYQISERWLKKQGGELFKIL